MATIVSYFANDNNYYYPIGAAGGNMTWKRLKPIELCKLSKCFFSFDRHPIRKLHRKYVFEMNQKTVIESLKRWTRWTSSCDFHFHFREWKWNLVLHYFVLYSKQQHVTRARALKHVMRVEIYWEKKHRKGILSITRSGRKIKNIMRKVIFFKCKIRYIYIGFNCKRKKVSIFLKFGPLCDQYQSWCSLFFSQTSWFTITPSCIVSPNIFQLA